MAVQELERRAVLAEMFPESPGAEVRLAHVDVVEELRRRARSASAATTRSRAKPPRTCDSRPVNQVDAPVGEVAAGVVEGRANQCAEGRVPPIVKKRTIHRRPSRRRSPRADRPRQVSTP